MYYKRNRILVKIVLPVILLLIFLFIILHHSLLPVFFKLAEVEAGRIANRAVSEAIDQETEDLEYRELIYYEKNNNGDIVLMQPNIRRINRFSSDVSLTIQEKLELIETTTVSVPLFQMLGLDFLASFGPEFDARIVPVGFVKPPEIVDNFESAGINQTRHKIYMRTDVALDLIVPLTSETVAVSSTLPMIEVTIMGEVPDVYVGLEGSDFSGILGGD